MNNKEPVRAGQATGGMGRGSGMSGRQDRSDQRAGRGTMSRAGRNERPAKGAVQGGDKGDGTRRRQDNIAITKNKSQ